jgi:hypothetical protein
VQALFLAVLGPVSDLALLKGMPLTILNCKGTMVSHLSPLKRMGLKELWCNFQPQRDAELRRSLTSLEGINGKPARQFWKEVDAKKC